MGEWKAPTPSSLWKRLPGWIMLSVWWWGRAPDAVAWAVDSAYPIAHGVIPVTPDVPLPVAIERAKAAAIRAARGIAQEILDTLPEVSDG